ncbi:MAG: hypothetical protein ACHQ7N_17540 [Candidatus Methylomirabilales bacterium]
MAGSNGLPGVHHPTGTFDEGRENLGGGLGQSLANLGRVRKGATVTPLTAGLTVSHIFCAGHGGYQEYMLGL